MSPVVVVLAVLGGVWLVALLLCGVCLVIVQWRVLADRRRRTRHGLRHQAPLSDREVMDALAPLGADISVWPSRAPRNGQTHEAE